MAYAIFVLLVILTGCTKEAILNHRDIYGEATINDLYLMDYVTLKESIIPELGYANLPINRLVITEDSICYIHTFLRKEHEENSIYPNFYLILIGLPIKDGFPVLSNDYEILHDVRIDYGERRRSFRYRNEIEKLIADDGSIPYGIAGIRTPTSYDHYIPLRGKLCFEKHDAKTNTYYISYAFETVENLDMPDTLRYEIKGFFKNQLKTLR